MSVFNSMKISTSGLTLERLKMDIASTNIANAKTTRTEEGGPYNSKSVSFEESIKRQRRMKTKNLRKMKLDLGDKRYFDLENKIFFQLDNEIGRSNKSFGVRPVEITEDTEGHDLVYNPDHPDANEEGYVIMSNVNMVDEMISLIESQRTYEANVTAFNTSKNMMKKALEISKG